MQLTAYCLSDFLTRFIFLLCCIQVRFASYTAVSSRFLLMQVRGVKMVYQLLCLFSGLGQEVQTGWIGNVLSTCGGIKYNSSIVFTGFWIIIVFI